MRCAREDPAAGVKNLGREGRAIVWCKGGALAYLAMSSIKI